MPSNENAEKYFSMMRGVKDSEARLQKQLCLWLKAQYPNILFCSGMQGFHLSDLDAKYASIINQPSKGQPDLLIIEPRGCYIGLALELKRDGATLYKKDGTFRKNEHLDNQQEVLEMYRQRGWQTGFAQGWDQAELLITIYLNSDD